MERSRENKNLNSLSEVGAEFEPVTSSQHLNWFGFSVERFRLHKNETATVTYSNFATLLMLGGSCKMRSNTIGGHFRTSVHQTNDVLVAPPGLFLTGFDHQHLDGQIVYFEPHFLENAARDFSFSGKIELAPQPKITDDFVRSINGFLLHEAANNNPSGRLYAESLATAYAIHLVKNYSVFPPQPASRGDKSGLSREQLRFVLEFIEANLAENLTIRELAQTLGISQHRLFRAFKVSMKTTLHRYVVQKRIEKAERLLMKTDSSLVEIAYLCGFSSQSHFTQIFRQTINSTPKEYRNVFRR